MFKRVILFSILFLVPALAVAEPTSKIKALMYEPMSLFDWLVYQVDEHLDMIEGVGQYRTVNSVRYDLDSNRLNLSIVSIVDGTEKQRSKQDAKDACREAIVAAKRYLFVDPNTGKISDFVSKSFLGQSVGHAGYVTAGWPDGVEEEVDRITVIKGRFLFGVAGNDIGTVECESPLLSNKIMFYEGK